MALPCGVDYGLGQEFLVRQARAGALVRAPCPPCMRMAPLGGVSDLRCVPKRGLAFAACSPVEHELSRFRDVEKTWQISRVLLEFFLSRSLFEYWASLPTSASASIRDFVQTKFLASEGEEHRKIDCVIVYRSSRITKRLIVEEIFRNLGVSDWDPTSGRLSGIATVDGGKTCGVFQRRN